MCRFVSVDPMKEERIWLNPYNYVQNNPINRIDPNGMLDEDKNNSTEEKGLQKTDGSVKHSEKDYKKLNEMLRFINPKNTKWLYLGIYNIGKKLEAEKIKYYYYYLDKIFKAENLSDEQKELINQAQETRENIEKYEEVLSKMIVKAYEIYFYNRNVALYNDKYKDFLRGSTALIEMAMNIVTAVELIGLAPTLYGGFKSSKHYLFSFLKKTASKAEIRLLRNNMTKIAKDAAGYNPFLDDFAESYTMRYGLSRAPKGGMYINGKFYKGGQFIPRVKISCGRGSIPRFNDLQPLSSFDSPGLLNYDANKFLRWGIAITGISGSILEGIKKNKERKFYKR
jgi:hypothetical protein